MTTIRKLGLTLGGGGARGSVHVGALIELEKMGFKPDMVSGTSIGGLIGALYAAGMGAKEMEKFFADLSISSMFRLPSGSPAMMSNTGFRQLLERTIGNIQFEQLEIPLSVVTVDLNTRREVVLDQGDVVTAVLATCSIPVALPPVPMGNMLLVDGGILNNTPFDVTRARGATTIIAISLSQGATYGVEVALDSDIPTPKGMIERALGLAQRGKIFQVATATIDIMSLQGFAMRLAIAKPEVLIRPYVGTLGIFDFHRWEEGIEIGKAAVNNSKAEIEVALERHYH